MKRLIVLCRPFLSLLHARRAFACSVIYYLDSQSGKIYVANNEDFCYGVETYIQILPSSGKKLARLWYGWDDFVQGGINEAGLFFDGAVRPEQEFPGKGKGPGGDLGLEILAPCHTVEETLDLLEWKDIALSMAHRMSGDASGNAMAPAVQVPGLT